MIIDSNTPFLEKIIKIINEKYPFDAPFVCLGLGYTFNQIRSIDGDTSNFTGVTIPSNDIERVSNGIYDSRFDLIMDDWMGSDSSAFYFAPLESRIAQLNPNAFTGRIKPKVNIIKIVL